NEGMARYQIDHVTGVTSGTEYTPPECNTMKSNANCFEPDRLCEQEWMTHPLKYYRTKQKSALDRSRDIKDVKKEKNGKKADDNIENGDNEVEGKEDT
ncbi:MAG TPA: hypothetical protein ENN76_00800, partial [Euryarchaeota archaeon]|nr:hypothetical protein [Euryarchaeota archaeon]